MTFYSESAKMADLVESLRSEVPQAYESVPGFRGIVVLEKSGGNHIIAVTLWEDEEGIRASEAYADGFAHRIGDAIGTAVSRNIYNVLGTTGITVSPEPPE